MRLEIGMHLEVVLSKVISQGSFCLFAVFQGFAIGSVGGGKLLEFCLPSSEATFGTDERVGFSETAIDDAVAHTAVEFVDLVKVNLVILLYHIFDEILILVVVIVELVKQFTVLFFGYFVLFFQCFYFIASTAQFVIGDAAQLPFHGPAVGIQLHLVFHHYLQGIGRIRVLLI